MNVERELIDSFIESVRMNIEDKTEFFGIKLSHDTGVSVYVKAIYLGYLDSCRTFKDQPKVDKEDDAVEDLAGLIQSYLIGKDDFDHSHYCNYLVKKYDMRFGQAQKIVNMAFKYLYCLAHKSDELIKKRFDRCHMPLDSTMLEWLCREAKCNEYPIVKSNVGAWSSMSKGSEAQDLIDEKYTYDYYQKILVHYCKVNKKCQLQLDFENWRIMNQTLAAEKYLKFFGKTEIENGLPQSMLNKALNI